MTKVLVLRLEVLLLQAEADPTTTDRATLLTTEEAELEVILLLHTPTPTKEDNLSRLDLDPQEVQEPALTLEGAAEAMRQLSGPPGEDKRRPQDTIGIAVLKIVLYSFKRTFPTGRLVGPRSNLSMADLQQRGQPLVIPSPRFLSFCPVLLWSLRRPPAQ